MIFRSGKSVNSQADRVERASERMVKAWRNVAEAANYAREQVKGAGANGVNDNRPLTTRRR